MGETGFRALLAQAYGLLKTSFSRLPGRRTVLARLIWLLTAIICGSLLFIVANLSGIGRWAVFLGVAAGVAVLEWGIVTEDSRRGADEKTEQDSMVLIAPRIVEDMRDGLAVWDQSGMLIDWNQAAVEITGWTQERARGLFSPHIQEGLVHLGEGQWIDVRRRTIRRRGQQFRAVLFTDARDRVALRDSERRFKTIFQKGPVPMAVTGSDFRILEANEALITLTGYRAGLLAGRKFSELAVPGEQCDESGLEQQLLNGEIPSFSSERRYVTKREDIISGRTTVSAVRDEAGNIVCCFLVFEDLTWQTAPPAPGALRLEEKTPGARVLFVGPQGIEP
jgi:PAS domain S-box-containing protein